MKLGPKLDLGPLLDSNSKLAISLEATKFLCSLKKCKESKNQEIKIFTDLIVKEVAKLISFDIQDLDELDESKELDFSIPSSQDFQNNDEYRRKKIKKEVNKEWTNNFEIDKSLIQKTLIISSQLDQNFSFKKDVYVNKNNKDENNKDENNKRIFIINLPTLGISIAVPEYKKVSTIITPIKNFREIIIDYKRAEIRDQSKINPLIGYIERNKMTIDQWGEELRNIINEISKNLLNGEEFEMKKIPEIDFKNKNHLRNLIGGVEELISDNCIGFKELRSQKFKCKDSLWSRTGSQVGTGVFDKHDSGTKHTEILARNLYPFEVDNNLINYFSLESLKQIFDNLDLFLGENGDFILDKDIDFGIGELNISTLLSNILGRRIRTFNENKFMILGYFFFGEDFLEKLNEDFRNKYSNNTKLDKSILEGLKNNIFDPQNKEHLKQLLEDGIIIGYEDMEEKIIKFGNEIKPEHVIHLEEKKWNFNLLWLLRKVKGDDTYEPKENIYKELREIANGNT